jgi:hypothetical protein
MVKSMTQRRTLPFATLSFANVALAAMALMLLAGCSRHTVVTVETDVLSFLAQEDRSGTFSLVADEYFLPDEDGISAEQLGFPIQLLEVLEGLALDLSVAVTSKAASGTESVTAAFHISDSASASPFDSPAYSSATVDLDPGETARLDFSVEISGAQDADVLQTFRSGHFRIGVRLEYTAGADASGVDYELEAVTVSISAIPGELVFF